MCSNRNRNIYFFNGGLLLVVCFLSLIANAQSSIKPQNLRCEYLVNPEGIDELAPRLSWTLGATDPSRFGQRQSAYKIIVDESPEKLALNCGELWSSGWVTSNKMRLVAYSGKPFVSDKKYYWKVAVKDENGKESAWSDMAFWSTGVLKRFDWTAKWIGTRDSFDAKLPECNLYDPWFRKTVELKDQPFKATMFLASVGYHELYVNGKKIGSDVLAPVVTDHSRRARYIAYDIASELKPGKNTIALWLGVSWSIFNPYATGDKPRAPIVIAQADIYVKGNNVPVMRIQTDDTWKTHPSPNKLLGTWSFGNMGGEIWDANKERTDWNKTECDESQWLPASIYRPRLTLSSQMAEPNRLFHEMHAVGIEKIADSIYCVDMGVNFAGWTAIKIKGKKGHRVDFLFSERQQEEMTFNNHSAYIIGPSGEGEFHNRFNYGSGRWITIKGPIEKPALTDIKGWVVRTNYPSATTFECSDSLQNWIYNKVKWNFENLSLGGYVVDCPQRERLGYGGDAHATSESGMFNYRLGAFYTKWMQDWRDVQGTKLMDPANYGGNADEGILPHTAPTYEGGGGPAWGGITVTLPWQIYLHEGDKLILEKNFELIKRWLAFLASHTTADDLMIRFGSTWDFLGDWLWPGANAEGMNNDKPENICFNNCYRVYNLRTAAKIATTIGKNAEAVIWEQQAEKISRAIHAKYYNEADHSYSDSSMRNLAAALLADVPPVHLRKTIMQRLEREIMVTRKGHIDAGITAGALLFKLLRAAGRDDLLYSMTSQTDYPGWGYMKANDATSLWEMWEKDLPGHSLLHSSYLYPGAWYIDGVAGIRRDEQFPGFRQFIIRAPLLKESQLSWAKASFDSPVGTIKSSWKREKGMLIMEVTVPPNTKAKLYFPTAKNNSAKFSSGSARKLGYENGFEIFELPAGTYVIAGKEL